jgi:hypothetical protein
MAHSQVDIIDPVPPRPDVTRTGDADTPRYPALCGLAAVAEKAEFNSDGKTTIYHRGDKLAAQYLLFLSSRDCETGGVKKSMIYKTALRKMTSQRISTRLE